MNDDIPINEYIRHPGIIKLDGYRYVIYTPKPITDKSAAQIAIHEHRKSEHKLTAEDRKKIFELRINADDDVARYL